MISKQNGAGAFPFRSFHAMAAALLGSIPILAACGPFPLLEVDPIFASNLVHAAFAHPSVSAARLREASAGAQAEALEYTFNSPLLGAAALRPGRGRRAPRLDRRVAPRTPRRSRARGGASRRGVYAGAGAAERALFDPSMRDPRADCARRAYPHSAAPRGLRSASSRILEAPRARPPAARRAPQGAARHRAGRAAGPDRPHSGAGRFEGSRKRGDARGAALRADHGTLQDAGRRRLQGLSDPLRGRAPARGSCGGPSDRAEPSGDAARATRAPRRPGAGLRRTTSSPSRRPSSGTAP